MKHRLVIYPGLSRSWVFPRKGDVLLYVDLGDGALTRFLTPSSRRPSRFAVSPGPLDVRLAVRDGEESLFTWSKRVSVPQTTGLALRVIPLDGRVLTKTHPQFRVEEVWR
jgi:hypothetical protein